jgi:hypothetical protein
MSAGPACRHLSQDEVEHLHKTKSINKTNPDAQWVKDFIDSELKDRPEKRIAFYRGVPLTEDNFTFQDLLNILSIEISKREYGAFPSGRVEL